MYILLFFYFSIFLFIYFYTCNSYFIDKFIFLHLLYHSSTCAHKVHVHMWCSSIRIVAHVYIQDFILCKLLSVVCLCGGLVLWVCRESWAHKRLFNLPSRFSRPGTRGACLSYVNVSCHNVLYVCECVMSQCILFMVLWRVLGSFSSF